MGLPRFLELRLDDDCGIEMTVLDSDNNVVATLAYDLVYVMLGIRSRLVARGLG